MATFDPTTLTFGRQAVGTTSTPQPVVVTNHDASVLSLSAPGFTFVPSSVGAATLSQVNIPTTATVNVAFTPTSAMSYDQTCASALHLTGTGVVRFAPASLTFDTRRVIGTTESKTVVVNPNEGESLALQCPGFTFSPNAVTQPNTTVTVTFAPTAAQFYSGTAGGGLALRGEGVEAFTPNHVDFGKHGTGTTGTRLVTVTNQTNAPMDLSATGRFSFAPSTVGIGQTVVVTVSFEPTSVTTYSRTVTKTGGTLTLTGEGVDSAAEIESDYVETDATQAGASSTQKFWQVDVDYATASAVSSDGTVETHLRLGTSAVPNNPSAPNSSEAANDHEGVDLATMVLTDANTHIKGGWRDHTDANHISTTRGHKVEVVRRRRATKVGESTARTISDRFNKKHYKPKDENKASFEIPDWLDGDGVSSTIDGEVVAAVTYADNTEVLGSRRLKVYDLLVEEVQGDRAMYTRGDHYHYVAGSHRLVIDGSDNDEENGDKTTTIRGDREETVYGDKTSTINGNSVSTVNGTSTSTIVGVQTSTVLGWQNAFRFGGSLSIDIALRLAVSLTTINVNVFTVVSLFGVKADFVNLKIDYAHTKVDNSSVMDWKKNMCVIADSVLTMGFSSLAFTRKNVDANGHYVKCDKGVHIFTPPAPAPPPPVQVPVPVPVPVVPAG